MTQRWVDEQSKSEAYKKFVKATELFREAAVFGHGGIFVGTHAMPVLFDLRTAHRGKAFSKAYSFLFAVRPTKRGFLARNLRITAFFHTYQFC